MTNADRLRAAALHEVGEDYHWGDEGTGGVDGDDDYDCSGFAWRMWGIGGYSIPRMTANDYYRKGTRIKAPSMVGDYFVMLDSAGHATHIGLFIGLGQTAESRNGASGVVKYTVSQVTARGAVWMRLPGANFGVLTQPKTRLYCLKTHGMHIWPTWASPSIGRFAAGRWYRYCNPLTGSKWVKLLDDNGKQRWGYGGFFK